MSLEIAHENADDGDLSTKQREMMRAFNAREFNERFVYLSREIAVELLGYSNHRDTLYDLYRKIAASDAFVRDRDYRVVAQDDEHVQRYLADSDSGRYELTRASPRRMHVLVTGKTLRHLVMMTHTNAGRALRDYYLKLYEYMSKFE